MGTVPTMATVTVLRVHDGPRFLPAVFSGCRLPRARFLPSCSSTKFHRKVLSQPYIVAEVLAPNPSPVYKSMVRTYKRKTRPSDLIQNIRRHQFFLKKQADRPLRNEHTVFALFPEADIFGSSALLDRPLPRLQRDFDQETTASDIEDAVAFVSKSIRRAFALRHPKPSLLARTSQAANLSSVSAATASDPSRSAS